MSEKREIELKFDIEPSAAEGLKGHALLRGRATDVKRTHSVYFDTPCGKLRKAGVTLRVRQAGNSIVQTVKEDGLRGAGLFDRAEWEAPLLSFAPDLGSIKDTAAERPLAKAKDRAALIPAFETIVDRQRWEVARDGAEIELVLDEGEVAAGPNRRPLAEVEFELKRGSKSALFDLARLLAGSTPLRVGVLTKSEQGFRLLGGERQLVVKAEPVALDRTMYAGDGFAATACSCIRHFRLNEPAVLGARNGEALHQARVALRRLRSAFSVFKPVVADRESGALRAELALISGTLGVARDLDVFISKRLGNVEPAAWEKVLGERERAFDQVVVALNAERFRSVMIELVAWLATGAWQEGPGTELPLPEFAASALDRFWGKVRKGGRHLAALDDDTRHEVRIAGKKLRYAADFFEGLYTGKKRRKRRGPFMRALERLQADLGSLNDIVTARDLTLSLPERIGVDLSDFDEMERGDRAKLLLASAEDAHAELVHAGPFWR